MRRLKTGRRPPIYPKTPGHLPCSSLTHPLPLPSRRPSVSFGGFGFSQRYERGSILVTTNLPFDEWTEVFGSERLTGALLDRLTHRAHILEMNGESYRLKQSRQAEAVRAASDPADA